jgi:hypothetical protein
MDNTLLKREVAPTQARTAGAENHERPTIEPAADDHVTEYRELAIEPAKPPLRLNLNPPIEYDGQKFNSLTFDFDALIGKDFQRAEKTFNKLYKADKNETVLPEMKHLYHCILAAQVADVPVGLIMKLPRRYYTPLRLEVLKSCGSSPEEESE